ncbi:hypothetical protein [Glaciimonas soli]|uniref:Uncharacterized protein n=1 Tax=Glaciimonas soli TaxID=2590999 RepID=A0A843YSR6_9BURK|nr:hypothetical protein [Glaciimonas soli]MQR02200.1 hypothetical protein [Glaciimonas soli]
MKAVLPILIVMNVSVCSFGEKATAIFTKAARNAHADAMFPLGNGCVNLAAAILGMGLEIIWLKNQHLNEVIVKPISELLEDTSSGHFPAVGRNKRFTRQV